MNFSFPIVVSVQLFREILSRGTKWIQRPFGTCIHPKEILRLDELHKRIEKTDLEYFVVAISGGYTLKQSSHSVVHWLQLSSKRHAYFLLINPETSIQTKIGFSGTHNITQEVSLCLEELSKAVGKNKNVSARLHVKFYDVAPVHSGFAFDCDVLDHNSNPEKGCFFIEGYGYATEWHDRPCYEIDHHIEPHFNVYRRSFRDMWNDAGSEWEWNL